MSIDLLPLPASGFATEPLPTRDGYRFTLTTLLGMLLNEAEELFGPRDMTFTPIGIEFYGDRPQIWYPGNRKHVSIMLTDSARTDTNQAIFQLAHEVVHLLAPSGDAGALVVEEGMAALFQQRASEKWELGYELGTASYIKSSELTNQLLKRDGHIIRTLRKTKSDLKQWTPRWLVSETGISLKLAEQLCTPFMDFEGK